MLDWSLWLGRGILGRVCIGISGLYPLDVNSTFTVTSQTTSRNCSMSPEGQSCHGWIDSTDQESEVRRKKPVMGTVCNGADPQGPPSPRGAFPSLSSLINAVPMDSCPSVSPLCLQQCLATGRGEVCPAATQFCASLSGLSHAPLPQLLRGSPETRAYCVVEAHRGLGAGWSVCVNILLSLRKPPTVAP